MCEFQWSESQNAGMKVLYNGVYQFHKRLQKNQV